MCLECGSRIALAYKRPPGWKLPVALTAILVVLLAVGAVIAYEAIGDEAEDEVAATPLKPKQVCRGRRTQRRERQPAEPEDRDSGDRGGELVPSGALYSGRRTSTRSPWCCSPPRTGPALLRSRTPWPRRRTAKAGVIRADDFGTLPKGFFVVFAGSYDTRERADRAASRLAATYPGAFAQLVRR